MLIDTIHYEKENNYGQQPHAKTQELVPSLATETRGRLTAAHSEQVYHPEQDKICLECCRQHLNLH